MNRDKQIDEMARIVDDNNGFIVSSVETAKALYNAGYRKASDVAEGIFEEIETSLRYKIIDGDIHLIIRKDDYFHYKKKYESEGGE